MDFMNIQEISAPVDPSSALARAQPIVPSPGVMAEVDRLLAGRTRDICLKGEILRLFRERTWPQTAKIIRSWMKWVVILDLLTLAMSLMTLPEAVTASMLLPASILPLAAVAVLIVWQKPRSFFEARFGSYSWDVRDPAFRRVAGRKRGWRVL